MKTVIVKCDNERPIKFKGEEIASAYSSPIRQRPDYSGLDGCWTELTLYVTKRGKYICAQVDLNNCTNLECSFSRATCNDVEQVIEFFGNGWLANELYESAGIDTSVEVE